MAGFTASGLSVGTVGLIVAAVAGLTLINSTYALAAGPNCPLLFAASTRRTTARDRTQSRSLSSARL